MFDNTLRHHVLRQTSTTFSQLAKAPLAHVCTQMHARRGPSGLSCGSSRRHWWQRDALNGESRGGGRDERRGQCKCRAKHKQGGSQTFRMGDLDKEIAVISLPALATLAADPIAGLVDTAYIGRLGAIELAAVGVALSAFNVVTKISNSPLLAVTTSLVATAQGAGKKEGKSETGKASSTALLIALGVGIVQATALICFGGSLLSAWGAAAGSELRIDATAFLRVKSLGAPVTVLLLVTQGVFRGLGDTRTPFIGTLAANVLNIILDPVFIFALGWGAPGAAAATVLSQAMAVVGLLFALSKRVDLKFGGAEAFTRATEFLGPTGLLAFRSLAITGTFSVATAMAARTDSFHAAAHQICFQLWLASSLLADALAVAAQSIMARNLAADNRPEARFVANRVVKLGVALGVGTGAFLAASSPFLPRLFTPDQAILSSIAVIFPWIVLTQPITALAFVWDGVLYGVNGFVYAARAMIVCALPAVGIMIAALAFPGQAGVQIGFVWAGLGVVMLMRTLAIYVPFKRGSTPFVDLYSDVKQ